MATPTYVALGTITLPSAASSVTFSGIPSTYRDLVVVVNGAVITTSSTMVLRLNGDADNQYSYTRALSYSGGLISDSTNGQTYFPAADSSPTEPHSTTINIMEYSATNKKKPILLRSDRAGLWNFMVAGRWNKTAAVTTVTLLQLSNNHSAGSTFSLYGVH